MCATIHMHVAAHACIAYMHTRHKHVFAHYAIYICLRTYMHAICTTSIYIYIATVRVDVYIEHDDARLYGHVHAIYDIRTHM